jgi:hypothetical protein
MPRFTISLQLRLACASLNFVTPMWKVKSQALLPTAWLIQSS